MYNSSLIVFYFLIVSTKFVLPNCISSCPTCTTFNFNLIPFGSVTLKFLPSYSRIVSLSFSISLSLLYPRIIDSLFPFFNFVIIPTFSLFISLYLYTFFITFLVALLSGSLNGCMIKMLSFFFFFTALL